MAHNHLLAKPPLHRGIPGKSPSPRLFAINDQTAASHPSLQSWRDEFVEYADLAAASVPGPLAAFQAQAYIIAMDQTPADPRPPQSWTNAIAQGEADLAAGRVSEIDIDSLCREIEAEADAAQDGQRSVGQPSAA